MGGPGSGSGSGSGGKKNEGVGKLQSSHIKAVESSDGKGYKMELSGRFVAVGGIGEIQKPTFVSGPTTLEVLEWKKRLNVDEYDLVLRSEKEEKVYDGKYCLKMVHSGAVEDTFCFFVEYEVLPDPISGNGTFETTLTTYAYEDGFPNDLFKIVEEDDFGPGDEMVVLVKPKEKLALDDHGLRVKDGWIVTTTVRGVVPTFKEFEEKNEEFDKINKFEFTKENVVGTPCKFVAHRIIRNFEVPGGSCPKLCTKVGLFSNKNLFADDLDGFSVKLNIDEEVNGYIYVKSLLVVDQARRTFSSNEEKYSFGRIDLVKKKNTKRREVQEEEEEEKKSSTTASFLFTVTMPPDDDNGSGGKGAGGGEKKGFDGGSGASVQYFSSFLLILVVFVLFGRE